MIKMQNTGSAKTILRFPSIFSKHLGVVNLAKRFDRRTQTQARKARIVVFKAMWLTIVPVHPNPHPELITMLLCPVATFFNSLRSTIDPIHLRDVARLVPYMSRDIA